MALNPLCTIHAPRKPTQPYELFHFWDDHGNFKAGHELDTPRLHKYFIDKKQPYHFQYQPALPEKPERPQIDDDLLVRPVTFAVND